MFAKIKNFNLDTSFNAIINDQERIVNTCEIYIKYIQLISGRIRVLTRDDYNEYYRNTLIDIECGTHPKDIIIINNQESDELEELFSINRECKEYKRIEARVKAENIKEILPTSHPVAVALINNTNTIDDIVEDIFINFCVDKFIAMVSFFQQQSISNFTPLIEYVVDNITLSDIKNFIHTKKIKHEKYEKYISKYVLDTNMDVTYRFYTSRLDMTLDPIHVTELLATNIDTLHDVYIVLGVYMVMFTAMSDFERGMEQESKCAKYVQEVISQI